MQVKKQQLEPDKEQQTCFKLGTEYIKAVYFHPAYLTYIQSEVKSLSRVRLFSTPWTVAYQAPPSMGFSRQESWNGLPFPSPGHLLNPEVKPMLLPHLLHCMQILYNWATGKAHIQSMSREMLGWMNHRWNQDCWDNYQQPQICRWYHSNGRKWKETKKPLDEGERREWKS